jgi:hypothetical protein
MYTLGYNFKPWRQKKAIAMPKQGDKTPWVMYQNYKLDKQSLNDDALEDGILIFSEAS